MPIVTQQRFHRPLSVTPKAWYSGGVVGYRDLDPSEQVLPTGDQSTTSWRTGKQFNPEEDDDLLRSTSGSHADLIRKLDRQSHDLGRFGATYDTGHEFSTYNAEILYGTRSAQAHRSFAGYTDEIHYDGPFWPFVSGSDSFPTPSLPDLSQINADGSRLMGMTIPTKPVAGMAQFFGELHEGLPRLTSAVLAKKAAVSQGLGNDYLNIQFGVKPFASDLAKLANGVLSFNQLAKQFLRDAGHVVRRRANLETQSSYVDLGTRGSGVMMGTIQDNYLGGPDLTQWLFDGSNPNSGLVYVSDSFTTETWFSGAWSYYVPSADNFADTVRNYEAQANHLLGTRITPQLIWELTPWSWLIDWFAHIGSFLGIISALSDDSLVLRYGYVMHKHSAVRTYTMRGLTPIEGSVPATIWSQYAITYKRRTRATPYGFGFDLSGLSTAQSAILSALGLTKAPGVLRR